MKKILLHIDPCDRRWEMLTTRSSVFLRLATILKKNGFQVQCFGPLGVMQPFADIVGKENVTESIFEYKAKDSYHALAWSNSLTKADFASLIHEYQKIDEDFDILVTNTPSALLRSIWPSSLILHFELGFFNRRPFPVCYQFDPFGFYHKSLLANYPTIYSKHSWLKNDFYLSKLLRLKHTVCSQTGISANATGKVPAVYIPLPSDTWASRVEHDYLDRVSYLGAMALMLSDKQILTNEKPQYPLSESEQLDLRRFTNIKFVKNEDLMGIGSALAAGCEATLTYSPSLSLQSIFWGNKYISPNGCSMASWSGIDDPYDVLASYVSNFQVFDLTEFIFKCEIWKSVSRAQL